VIGVLRALQTKKGKTVRNDRFIAVAEEAREFEEVHDVRDLPPRTRREITHFFISYNELEDRRFKPGGMLGAKEARRLLEPFAPGRETAKTR
jgi:inorganic pyrophosphatase